MARHIINLVYGSLGVVVTLGGAALAVRAHIKHRRRLALMLFVALTSFSLTPLATVFWAVSNLSGLELVDLWPLADSSMAISLGLLAHVAFLLGGLPRAFKRHPWLVASIYVLPVYNALLWIVPALQNAAVGTAWFDSFLFNPELITAITGVVIAAVGFTRLWLLQRHSGSVEVKIQAKWLFIGLVFAVSIWLATDAVFVFMQLPVPAYLEVPFGTLPTLGIAATFTVAILQHRLIDVDLVVTRGIVYTVLALIAALAYGGIISLIAATTETYQPGAVLVFTAMIVAVTLALTPAYHRLKRWAVASFYPKTFALPESLEEISRYALRSRASVTDVLSFLAEKAHAALETQYVVAFYAVHGVPPLVPYASAGDVPSQLAGWNVFPERIPKEVWRSQEPLSTHDIESNYGEQEWVQRLTNSSTEWVVPLYFEGRPVGLLCIGPVMEGRHIVSQDVEHLTAAAYHAVLILEARRFKDMAMYDHLTGLLTRQAFEGLMREVLVTSEPDDSSESFCLAMLDIDGFKALNDELGHLGGDNILRSLGHILKDSVRPEDLVARYGGDEFVICLVGVTLEEGRTVLERLQERIREFDFPDRSGEPCLEVTVSVGLMSATVPNTYLEPEDLDAYMGHCDRALYLAKSLGNNKLVSDSFCGETAAE